jgi:hypothetical protein
MTTLSNEVAGELASALRENSLEAAKLRAAYRAALPQWLDDRALRARYAIDDSKQLRAALALYRIASLPKGRGFKVHVDDYLRLDEALKRERALAKEVA